MRKALDRVEARRRQIERQILDEIEARFFSQPSPVIDHQVSHLGSAVAGYPEGIATGCASQFSLTWFE